ncbi:MAG: hypothetical protein RIT27_349 [Pseudomonadota bacterium]|jgi:predicted DNA-binding protein
MNAITLSETLLENARIVADREQLSLEAVISQALEEYLEDYFDVLAAEEVLAKIKSGEEQVFSLEEVEKMLNELAD